MLPFSLDTTTYVVDDDQFFLESFAYGVAREIRCKTNCAPPVAIEELERHWGRWQHLLNLVSPTARALEVDGHSTDNVWCLRRHPLSAIASDQARHELVSVVIVDFAMPSMSGIELFRRIKHLPFRKILLTGKAGDETAVAAFNEGLIDLFWVKQDRSLPQSLTREIRRLEHEFLKDRSGILSTGPIPSALNFINDSRVSIHLNDLWKRHSIVEHYLWDDPPGFLTIDSKGQHQQVICYDSDMMRAQQEIASECDAPRDLINTISKGKAIARFPGSTGLFEVEFGYRWREFVWPAERVAESDWWIAVCGPAPANWALKN